MVVYAPDAEEKSGEIPQLVKGEHLDLVRLLPEQHFTQPPPRYTEASLVKAMEENGIGRPSTYAPTISTIQQRGYVEREDRSLRPTEIGVIVNDLLAEHFPDVISVGFTAEMEAHLDEVAAGEADWVQVLRDFYGPFSQRLAAAQENMPELNLGDQPVGRDCPQCGHPLVLKWGRYGKFIACQNYPECKHTEPWLDKIGVNCPQCGGDLVRKRTRRGRPFYGCARYPECDFTSWKQPLPTPCPACGGLLVLQKKGVAQCIQCEEQIPLRQLARDGRVELLHQLLGRKPACRCCFAVQLAFNLRNKSTRCPSHSRACRDGACPVSTDREAWPRLFYVVVWVES